MEIGSACPVSSTVILPTIVNRKPSTRIVKSYSPFGTTRRKSPLGLTGTTHVFSVPRSFTLNVI